MALSSGDMLRPVPDGQGQIHLTLSIMINYVAEMFPGEMMGHCSSRLDVSRVVKRRIPEGNKIIGV